MPCIHCGADTEPGQDTCINCRQKPEVTVLPPEERENFNGLTIEPDSNDKDYHQSQTNHSNPHVFVHQFNFGSAKGNLLLKLLIGAVFLVIVILALPVALIFLAFFIINWLFIRHSSR
jgi:hypothetical protein